MLDELFKEINSVRKRGKRRHRDHFTLMAFSTHWKATFDQIDLDVDGREQVSELPAFSTPEAAIKNAIKQERPSIIIPDAGLEFPIGRIIEGIRMRTDAKEKREMHLEIDRLLIENEALKEENKRNKEVARELSLELERVRNQRDDGADIEYGKEG